MEGTGRIHIYYGEGKGKTSAALGLALRAAGAGLEVLFYQFLKDNSAHERPLLEALPHITCLPGRERVRFFGQLNGEQQKEVSHYYNKAFNEIVKFCPNFDVLILDEVLDLIPLQIIGEAKLFSFLEHKPRGLEVVLTGHAVSEAVIAHGDYVTRLEKVAHPYDKGRPARAGIEY